MGARASRLISAFMPRTLLIAGDPAPLRRLSAMISMASASTCLALAAGTAPSLLDTALTMAPMLSTPFDLSSAFVARQRAAPADGVRPVLGATASREPARRKRDVAAMMSGERERMYSTERCAVAMPGACDAYAPHGRMHGPSNGTTPIQFLSRFLLEIGRRSGSLRWMIIVET